MRKKKQTKLLTSHQIYYTCKHLQSLSSSTQHDVYCVNYGPIQSKLDDKAGHALWCV